MRVAFLVAELGRSGGMAVIRDHARHLGEREGMECELLVCEPGADVPADVGGVPARRLADAAADPVDVAVATWWTTAERLWDLPARCRAVLAQGLDLRYYRESEHADRLGAEALLDLPVHWLVVSEHLRRVLAQLRPEARAWLAPPGVDKAVFAPADGPPREGALRVLVEGQPSMWFKGVREAVTAVRDMAEPATVTVVAADPSHAGGAGADRVVGGLSPAEMASLYAEHDVLLKLSRFEGLGLPLLEAFHVGLPCVVTPFGGAAELVVHGENGLVVGFDDEPGTVAALDRLAGDPALRARLRAGGLATAARWPDRAAASAAFAAALRELAAADPPDPDVALRRLALGRRRAIEVQRREQLRLRGVRSELDSWQDAWRQADAKLAEYDGWTQELRARVEALQRRPGFRVEERLRRLGRREG